MIMDVTLRFLNLLSILERKHDIAGLDPSSRAILNIVVERAIAGKSSTAEDIIAVAPVSRASVYRKLNALKDNGSLVEVWQDHRMTFVVGDKMNSFVQDVVHLAADAGK